MFLYDYLLLVPFVAFFLSILTIYRLLYRHSQRNIFLATTVSTIFYALQVFTAIMLVGRECSGTGCGMGLAAFLVMAGVSVPVVFVLGLFVFRHINKQIKVNTVARTSPSTHRIAAVAYIVLVLVVLGISFTEPAEYRKTEQAYDALSESSASLPIQPNVTILGEFNSRDKNSLGRYLHEVVLIEEDGETMFFSFFNNSIGNSIETVVHDLTGTLLQSCEIPYETAYQTPTEWRVYEESGTKVEIKAEFDLSKEEQDIPMQFILDPYTCEIIEEMMLEEELEWVSDWKKRERFLNDIYYLHSEDDIDVDGDGTDEKLYGVRKRLLGDSLTPREVLYVIADGQSGAFMGVYEVAPSPDLIIVEDVDGDGREGIVVSQAIQNELGHFTGVRELLYIEFE